MRIDKSEARDYGWEIATGWSVGGDVGVSHYYFYSQRTSEGREGATQDKEREWGRRLFYEDWNAPGDALRVSFDIPEFLAWLGNWWERDIEGNGDTDMAPESIIQDPPYEEGVDYDEDDDEDDDEDAEAQAMQEIYLEEMARRDTKHTKWCRFSYKVK
jgi:predicted nuclease of restriction endonuclease-like (RecB) superfamily